MTQTVKEQLIAAKALIANPDNWCRFSYAKDAENNTVGFMANQACKWCASGAVARAINPKTAEEYYSVASQDTEAHRALIAAAYAVAPSSFDPNTLGNPVLHLNDKLTHEVVMTMFDKAIESA